MNSRIKLLVGLGNPGDQYSKTRHNAGFWFVDRLAEQAGVQFRRESKFHGDYAKCALPQEYGLFKPETYMNRSGQAVGAIASFYHIEPEAILIAHDELDLPPGTARLKRGGGHGGHNGLRDIMQHLGSKEFLRLRIGIGHPGNSKQVADYVLKKPLAEEHQAIEQALEAAFKVLPFILQGEADKAMNQLHSA